MVMIEVHEFKKSYGAKSVHKAVSFEVKKGECMGLLGGSGTGKSVILRSLIGLEKPDSGRIVIAGTDITKMHERDLLSIRKKVAYAFQNGALFDSMTVYENLAYPLREHFKLSEYEIKDKVFAQLADFGLQGNENIYPTSLSGGMQKRVGLVRAMMMDPEVILYDEPTAGLDPFNTKKIQEVILKLKAKGVTSILVTHDMPTALAVCDRMAILSKGQVAAHGTMQELGLSDLGAGATNPISKFINGDEF
jgi:phospholipid/cholesterol/gamma-HCH transport system ATP-binding protein